MFTIPALTTPHLEATDLSVIRHQHLLFANISFQLHPNEILWIEGPNGCGKSTLLRLLAGIATPARGVIHWQGIPIHTTKAYSEQLHYVSHYNGIKPNLSVYENLKWIALLIGCSPNPVQFDHLLEQLNLRHCQHQLINTLSAGQKRRLALAKLWLSHRPIWILDEPFTALDAETQALVRYHLEKHLQQQGLALMTSHHPIQLNDIKIKSLRLSSC